MLRNERYVGVWRFKSMQWVKVPGTNRRLPRKRPASETMVRQRPDLLIVDLALWQSVQTAIAKGSPMRGRRRPKSRYLLSGILVCAHCGAGLTICGASPSYYRCPSRVRGLCPNGASLRTAPLLADVFDEIRCALRKSSLLREALDVQNANRGEALQEQVEARRAALLEIEQQIERFVKFVADGADRLDYVAEKIGHLESDARVQKAEIEILSRILKKPIARTTTCEGCLGRGSTSKRDAGRSRRRSSPAAPLDRECTDAL